MVISLPSLRVTPRRPHGPARCDGPANVMRITHSRRTDGMHPGPRSRLPGRGRPGRRWRHDVAAPAPPTPLAAGRWFRRGRPGDVDQPVDAEFVGAHAEGVTPRSEIKWHGDGAAGRELVPVAAQLALVRLLAA